MLRARDMLLQVTSNADICNRRICRKQARDSRNCLYGMNAGIASNNARNVDTLTASFFVELL